MIAISAAAAGMALLPPRCKAAQEAVTWQSKAMGAQASLVIHHPDRAMALKLTNDVVAEVRRLERIFSLYMDDSDLTRLNRQRFLIAPPRELVDILRQSREVWTLTAGAFDPTLRPRGVQRQAESGVPLGVLVPEPCGCRRKLEAWRRYTTTNT